MDYKGMSPAPAPVTISTSDDVVTSWETDGRGTWLFKVYTVDGSKNMRPYLFTEDALPPDGSTLDEWLNG